eukprot:933447_1
MTKLCSVAKHRNKGDFLIDFNFLVDLWNVQEGLCHLSKYPMCHSANSNWKCSLERLDNSRGYETDNVALICQEFNTSIQWTHALMDVLPNKIDEYVDVEKMDAIFFKMHNMDRKVVAHRKCVYCDQNKPNGGNKFCEQCKKQHPEIIRHWQSIQRTLRNAQRRKYKYKICPLRRQYALSATWAQNVLKQQQYRCYYFNIPLQF